METHSKRQSLTALQLQRTAVLPDAVSWRTAVGKEACMRTTTEHPAVIHVMVLCLVTLLFNDFETTHATVMAGSTSMTGKTCLIEHAEHEVEV